MDIEEVTSTFAPFGTVKLVNIYRTVGPKESQVAAIAATASSEKSKPAKELRGSAMIEFSTYCDIYYLLFNYFILSLAYHDVFILFVCRPEEAANALKQLTPRDRMFEVKRLIYTSYTWPTILHWCWFVISESKFYSSLVQADEFNLSSVRGLTKYNI